MKHLTLTLLILLFPSLLFAGNGSFLILKSAYLYQNANQEGQKILTRDRRAYDVLDIYNQKGASLMFLIEFSGRTEPVNGSGFIVETEAELKEIGVRQIKVYSEIPRKTSDLTDYRLVSSNQLSFTGRQEHSPDFPNLFWRTVNYKIEIPLQLWVPDWAGIYRPTKDADWLNQAYESAIAANLDKTMMDKLLMGQVEAGYSKEQVKMALGEPLKEQLTENDTKLEWIYDHRKVIFVNNQVLRVL